MICEIEQPVLISRYAYSNAYSNTIVLWSRDHDRVSSNDDGTQKGGDSYGNQYVSEVTKYAYLKII